MSPGRILVSDDGFDSLHAPLTNELAGDVADVHPVKLSHYRYEKVRLRDGQTADSTFPLCHVQIRHIKSLVVSVRALTFK